MTYNEILEYVYRVGSNNVGVFGGLYEGGYQLQQVPQEISKMIFDLKQANVQIKNYCEIGAASHGLTRLMRDLFDIENVLTIDLDLNWPGKLDNLEALASMGNFDRCLGDSHSQHVRDVLSNYVNTPFDFVVIDGDHSYEGVKADWDMVFPHVKHDGFLMLHDTDNEPGKDVNKFYTELQQVQGLPEAHFYEFGHYIETPQYKGIGLLRKQLPC